MDPFNRLLSDKPLSLAVDSVPPTAGPDIYILRLKGGELFSFTIYSRALWGVWVHWSGKKSEPHFSDEGRCPGCQARRPKRWKGFLHVFCHEKGQEMFLELTPSSARSLLDQLGPGTVLRGNRIQCKRTRGDNGRLQISLLTAHANLEALPAEKHPQKSLLALWGLDVQQDRGGKEFPLPRPSENGAFH